MTKTNIEYKFDAAMYQNLLETFLWERMGEDKEFHKRMLEILYNEIDNLKGQTAHEWIDNLKISIRNWENNKNPASVITMDNGVVRWVLGIPPPGTRSVYRDDVPGLQYQQFAIEYGVGMKGLKGKQLKYHKAGQKTYGLNHFLTRDTLLPDRVVRPWQPREWTKNNTSALQHWKDKDGILDRYRYAGRGTKPGDSLPAAMNTEARPFMYNVQLRIFNEFPIWVQKWLDEFSKKFPITSFLRQA